ncbi:hypothetical protein KHA80_19615 [Anaerobacillus sp. HL2]|nr:hypothetical protein KHA80_19615 [Anaerobacillus sp. HL2]
MKQMSEVDFTNYLKEEFSKQHNLLLLHRKGTMEKRTCSTDICTMRNLVSKLEVSMQRKTYKKLLDYNGVKVG